MSRLAIETVRDAGFEVMVIPSGPYMEEQLTRALKDPTIDYVGLSYSKTSQQLGRSRHSATSRFDFLSAYVEGACLPYKKIHMLGMVSAGEIALMKPFEYAIKSWDSSIAVWSGLHVTNIRQEEKKMPISVDFDSKLPWHPMVNHNIGYIYELLKV
ncbi:MAG: hypothetical protein JHC33_08830 [Ignisphaera sp.]|nr:hypothetical protein [Ignisphaera sp.]